MKFAQSPKHYIRKRLCSITFYLESCIFVYTNTQYIYVYICFHLKILRHFFFLSYCQIRQKKKNSIAKQFLYCLEHYVRFVVCLWLWDKKNKNKQTFFFSDFGVRVCDILLDVFDVIYCIFWLKNVIGLIFFDTIIKQFFWFIQHFANLSEDVSTLMWSLSEMSVLNSTAILLSFFEYNIF